MIELRFLVPEGTHVPPPIPRLQYRILRPAPYARFPNIGPSWSEWMDVPQVVDTQKPSIPVLNSSAFLQMAEERPVIVPADMPADIANDKYGERYGVDWTY